CHDHDSEMSWFCYSEEKPVCSACAVVGKCKEHKVKPVQQKASDIRNKLVDLCEKLQQKTSRIERHMTEVLPGKNQNVASAASSARELVIQRFNYIREACETEEQRLLEQVHAEEERAHQNILTQRAHWTHSSEKLTNVKSYLVDMLTTLEDQNLLKSQEEIFERAEEAEGLLEPKKSEQLNFNLNCIQSPLLHGLWASAFLISTTDVEDVQINEKTISPSLTLSEDKKTLTFVSKKIKTYQYCPERFNHWPNSVATKFFENGAHAWKVDIGKSCAFKLGICYGCHSRKGSGNDSRFGYNAFSWVFTHFDNEYSFFHDKKQWTVKLLKRPAQIGVLVDVEGGQLLFYDPDSCTIIYSYQTKFTAPVYPAFAVAHDSITIR
uniref:B-box and SPRY domain containing n=1 Tax=Latimeria chalumnae TaxID=7897 RepID=H3BAG1_LATCH